MTIGTGIFLGALILSLTYLFVATKDRWRWKRLTVGLIGALAAFVALGGGGLWGYKAWEDRVRPIDELGGIHLGMSQEDVLFFKGKASEEVEGDWVYKDDAHTVSYKVSFKDGAVNSVLAVGRRVSLPVPLGISGFAGTQAVEQRLGTPSAVVKSGDGSSRLLHYESLNLMFGFENDRLEAVGIRRDGKTWKFARWMDAPVVGSGPWDAYKREPVVPRYAPSEE